MNDRELLELAAKAAGIGPVIGFAVEASELMIGPRSDIRYWNPLADDGAALRLAVKLRTSIFLASNNTACESVGDDYWFDDGIDAAAARRAIVNAAARIGRTMP